MTQTTRQRAIEAARFALEEADRGSGDYTAEAAAAFDAIMGVLADHSPIFRDDDGHVVHEVRGNPGDVWRAIAIAIQERRS